MIKRPCNLLTPPLSTRPQGLPAAGRSTAVCPAQIQTAEPEILKKAVGCSHAVAKSFTLTIAFGSCHMRDSTAVNGVSHCRPEADYSAAFSAKGAVEAQEMRRINVYHNSPGRQKKKSWRMNGTFQKQISQKERIMTTRMKWIVCGLIGLALATGNIAVAQEEAPGRREEARVQERSQRQVRQKMGEEKSSVCEDMDEEEKAAMRARHRAHRELRDKARAEIRRMREKRQATAAERRDGAGREERETLRAERRSNRENRRGAREKALREREARRDASEK